MIHVKPRDTLVDKDVTIVVGGLKSGQKVTLRGSCHNDSNDLFESFAFYKSNEDGIVNVLRDRAMYGGSYEGVEPMGLFWSMQESKLNKKKFARMVKKNVGKPLVVKIELFHGWEDLNGLRNEQPTISTEINRWYKSKGVTRVPIKAGKIRGTLFIPCGNGPFPAMLDMFGVAGGLFEFRASMFASRGFLTLALALFGYDDLQPTVSDMDLGYFEEAVHFLQNHPKSIQGGVGVVATSLGAELALCMSTYLPGVTCCVSINGANFVETFSYSYRQFKIPAMTGDIADIIFKDGNTMYTKNLFPMQITQKNMRKHLVEFHKSSSAVLFIRSLMDGCYDMFHMNKLTTDLLQRYEGGAGKYKTILYPGAGHLLELPNTPLTATVFMGLAGKMYQFYGGRIKDHAKAQDHSWKEILKFLNENLIPKTNSKL